MDESLAYEFEKFLLTTDVDEKLASLIFGRVLLAICCTFTDSAEGSGDPDQLIRHMQKALCAYYGERPLNEIAEMN